MRLLQQKTANFRADGEQVGGVEIGDIDFGDGRYGDARHDLDQGIDLELAQIDQGEAAQFARAGLAQLQRVDGGVALDNGRVERDGAEDGAGSCLLYTSPSPRDS